MAVYYGSNYVFEEDPIDLRLVFSVGSGVYLVGGWEL